MKKILNEEILRNIVKESILNFLNEAQVLIDNFDKVKDIIGSTDDGDNFFFVQIIKRFKDNPNMDKMGNYHAGGGKFFHMMNY